MCRNNIAEEKQPGSGYWRQGLVPQSLLPTFFLYWRLGVVPRGSLILALILASFTYISNGYWALNRQSQPCSQRIWFRELGRSIDLGLHSSKTYSTIWLYPLPMGPKFLLAIDDRVRTCLFHWHNLLIWKTKGCWSFSESILTSQLACNVWWRSMTIIQVSWLGLAMLQTLFLTRTYFFVVLNGFSGVLQLYVRNVSHLWVEHLKPRPSTSVWFYRPRSAQGEG